MSAPPQEPRIFGWDVVRLLGSTLAAFVLVPALRPLGTMLAGTPWGSGDTRIAAALAVGLVVAVSMGWDLVRRNSRRDAAILALAIVFVAGVALAVVLQHVGGLDCPKARRSLGDMVTAGTALEDHRRARGAYPAAGTDVEALARALEPTFVATRPRRDGWGRAYAYDVAPESWSVASAALGDFGDRRPGRGPIELTMRGLTGWPGGNECRCPGHLLEVLTPPAP